MTQPRLTGPRVALVPAPRDVAAAVVDGSGAHLALAAVGLAAAPDWPHEDTADALRPLAEHGEEGVWLVVLPREDAATQVVGECGWRPGPHGEVELGYGLAVSARRQGLGTEAVGLLAAWVERQPGVRLLTAEVRVGNEASQRLLARLAFVPDPAQADSAQADGGSPHDQVRARDHHLRLVRAVPGRRLRVTGRHVC